MQGDSCTPSSADEYLAVISFALTKKKRKHKTWVRTNRSAFATKEKTCCYDLIKELGAMVLGSDRILYNVTLRFVTS